MAARAKKKIFLAKRFARAIKRGNVIIIIDIYKRNFGRMPLSLLLQFCAQFE